MSPIIRTLIFTVFVPGFWTVMMPYWMLPLDAPKKLVVEGPYRIVRNPMYWSVASVMLGEAAVSHSAALAELAAAFFVGASLFTLSIEEPALK